MGNLETKKSIDVFSFGNTGNFGIFEKTTSIEIGFKVGSFGIVGNLPKNKSMDNGFGIGNDSSFNFPYLRGISSVFGSGNFKISFGVTISDLVSLIDF